MVSSLVLAVTALFIPPFPVAVRRGCGADLLINLLLTLFCWIPGVMHAFFIIVLYSGKDKYRHDRAPRKHSSSSSNGRSGSRARSRSRSHEVGRVHSNPRREQIGWRTGQERPYPPYQHPPYYAQAQAPPLREEKLGYVYSH